MAIDVILLSECLKSSGKESSLEAIDSLLSFFIGESDNLTTTELLSALEECKIGNSDILSDDSIYNTFSLYLS